VSLFARRRWRGCAVPSARDNALEGNGPPHRRGVLEGFSFAELTISLAAGAQAFHFHAQKATQPGCASESIGADNPRPPSVCSTPVRMSGCGPDVSDNRGGTGRQTGRGVADPGARYRRLLLRSRRGINAFCTK